MDDLPRPGDRVLDRFCVERELGTGGMGVVYLAHDELLDLAVALKYLNPWVTKANVVDRFKREVLLARRVSHPNICRIYDLHADSGTLFLSMEYVAGPTLLQEIASAGVLPVPVACRVVEAISRAIAAAHALGVIHRDLKPGNIVLRPDGAPTILDFGVSKALDLAGITATGVAVGTLAYMAPEVIIGRPVTPRSDIYSLGVVLYECLTGRLPFDVDDLVALPLAYRQQQPVAPRQLNPNVSAELEALVCQALAIDPAARTQTAEQLAQGLAAARQQLPPVATERTVRFAPGPWHGDVERSVQEAVAAPVSAELLRSGVVQTTILFSDIVGITPYFDRHGDAAGLAKIQRHNDLLFPIVRAHHGQVVKTIGDAIMACFATAEAGVTAAAEMQCALQATNSAESDPDERIKIRIGLHSGASVARSRDLYGNTVNVAARICGRANGDQILISAATFQMLSDAVATSAVGPTELKGLAQPVELWRVEWQPDAERTLLVDPIEISADNLEAFLPGRSTPAPAELPARVDPPTTWRAPTLVAAALGLIGIGAVAWRTFDSRQQQTPVAPAAVAGADASVERGVHGSADAALLPGSVAAAVPAAVVTPTVVVGADDKSVGASLPSVERPAVDGDGQQVARLERALHENMRTRSLLPGDLPELDRMSRQAQLAKQQRRYAQAQGLLQQAGALVERTPVDRAFVDAKLLRLNQRYDASAVPDKELRWKKYDPQIRAAMQAQDWQRANALLSELHDLLRQ